MKTEVMTSKSDGWLNSYLSKLTGPARKGAGLLATAGELAAMQHTGPLPKTFDDRFALFESLLACGAKALVRAGQVLMEMTNSDPDAYESILKRSPHLTAKFLLLLERVGRKEVYVNTLFVGDPYVAARIERLSYADQVKVTEHPLPVVTGNAGEQRTEQKRLGEMTRAEALTLIGDTLRDPAQQAEFLKAQAVQQRVRETSRWIIDGEQVFFLERGPFGIGELQGILEKLTGAAVGGLQEELTRKQITKCP